MDVLITLSDMPEPEAERIMSDGLHGFNDGIVGYADRLPLNVVVQIPHRAPSSAAFAAALLCNCSWSVFLGRTAPTGHWSPHVADSGGRSTPQGMPNPASSTTISFSGAGLLSAAWMAASARSPATRLALAGCPHQGFLKAAPVRSRAADHARHRAGSWIGHDGLASRAARAPFHNSLGRV